MKMRDLLPLLSFWLGLIVLLISLNSCFPRYSEVDGRTSSPTRVKLLEDTVESYANSLRWGYYEEIQKMGGNRWDTSSLIKRFRKK